MDGTQSERSSDPDCYGRAMPVSGRLRVTTMAGRREQDDGKVGVWGDNLAA